MQVSCYYSTLYVVVKTHWKFQLEESTASKMLFKARLFDQLPLLIQLYWLPVCAVFLPVIVKECIFPLYPGTGKFFLICVESSLCITRLDLHKQPNQRLITVPNPHHLMPACSASPLPYPLLSEFSLPEHSNHAVCTSAIQGLTP